MKTRVRRATISLDHALYESIKARAAREGRTFSEMVRILLVARGRRSGNRALVGRLDAIADQARNRGEGSRTGSIDVNEVVYGRRRR